MLISGNNINGFIKKYTTVILIGIVCVLVSVAIWFLYDQKMEAIDDRINNVSAERSITK